MKECSTTAQSTMPPLLFFLLFIVGVLCSYLSQVAYWENFVVAVLRRGENRVPLFFCFPPHSRTITSVMAQTTSNLQNFGSIQECQWKEHCREGTTPHNDAVLNEIIYFAVFRGLKINLCSWEVEQKNRQRYELLETVLSLSSQGKKKVNDDPEEESSEDATLQCSFPHYLIRGWRRFCLLIPGFHEKGEGQDLLPNHAASLQPALVISHVMAVAVLVRGSGQDTS